MLLALLTAACAGELGDTSAYEEPLSCGLDIRDDIFVPRCGLSGCHRPGESAAGVEYVTPGLADRLYDSPSTTCDDARVIDPANPDASVLLIITSEDRTCGDKELQRMPQIGQALDEREMACLREWVHRVIEERQQP